MLGSCLTDADGDRAHASGLARAERWRRRVGLWLAVAAVMLSAAGAGAALAEDAEPIRVTNYPDTRTIGYPLALIEGELADRAARQVRVVNASSHYRDRSLLGQAYDGRFRALIQLVPGENELHLRGGGHEKTFTLTYEPDTNEHKVMAHLLVASDDEPGYQTPYVDDPQNYQQKIGLGMMVMQTLTAELMHEAGLGRRTFNLEYDAESGRVAVHTLSSDWTREQFHDLEHDHPMYAVFDHVYQLVREQYADESAKHMIYLGMSQGPGEKDWHFHNPELRRAVRDDGRLSPQYAHTALGGGDVAILNGGDLWAWPDRVKQVQQVMSDPSDNFGELMGDYSQSRGVWGPGTIRHMVADNWGASLHELGHTFGRPHEGDAETSIMYHGYNVDRNLNMHRETAAGELEPVDHDGAPRWAPVSAANLRYHAWFDSEAEQAREQREIVMVYEPEGELVRISAPAGLREVHFLEQVEDDEPDAVEQDVQAFEEDAEVRERAYTLEQLERRAGVERFGLVVIDDDGHIKHRTRDELLGD